MSAGQITTALAFVVSGFVQLAIDNELTPIPDYGNQNSLMVINGYHQVQKNSENKYIKLLDIFFEKIWKSHLVELEKLEEDIFGQISPCKSVGVRNFPQRHQFSQYLASDFEPQDGVYRLVSDAYAFT